MFHASEVSNSALREENKRLNRLLIKNGIATTSDTMPSVKSSMTGSETEMTVESPTQQSQIMTTDCTTPISQFTTQESPAKESRIEQLEQKLKEMTEQRDKLYDQIEGYRKFELPLDITDE